MSHEEPPCIHFRETGQREKENSLKGGERSASKFFRGSSETEVEKFKEKLFSGIRKEGNGCWTWTRGKTSCGYGAIYLKSRQISTHSAVFLLLKGNIPPLYDLDHLCRNRCCCNPDHLEAVTRLENLVRGNTIVRKAILTTHCPKGHEYSKVNTITRNGKRECRECKREFSRVYYKLKKDDPEFLEQKRRINNQSYQKLKQT